MHDRIAKYYFIATAIAVFVAVAQGVEFSFGAGPHEAYCDYDVAAERANLETPLGTCRLRIGRIVYVFGGISLVLLCCFWLPAGLYLYLRWVINSDVSRPTVAEQRQLDCSGFPAPQSQYPRTNRIVRYSKRWAGPLSVGYFTITAFCVFQYVGFAAWVNLNHNPMGSYCRYDKASVSGNFYAYGQLCNIDWAPWLGYWFGLFVVITAILQVPIILVGAMVLAIKYCRKLNVWRS